jgi:hypothetical protein
MLALVAAALFAQADAGFAEAPGIVVRRLDANKVAADLTDGLSALFAERVKSADSHFKVYSQADIERVLSAERQAQLMGCANDECLAELSGALGARYILSGRIDRFGDRYVLTAGLFDTQITKLLVQSRREAIDPGKLPAAADEMADELLAPLGVAPRVNKVERLDETGFTISLDVSTQLFTSLAHLAPGGDLELGYRITSSIMAYLQFSFLITFGETTNTSFLPGEIGVRYLFRAGKSFQPYAGAGFGLLFAVRKIEDAAGQNTQGVDARPSLWAHTGLAYVITPWIAVTFDFSLDVLGAALNLFNDNPGVNFGAALGVMFRF